MSWCYFLAHLAQQQNWRTLVDYQTINNNPMNNYPTWCRLAALSYFLWRLAGSGARNMTFTTGLTYGSPGATWLSPAGWCCACCSPRHSCWLDRYLASAAESISFLVAWLRRERGRKGRGWTDYSRDPQHPEGDRAAAWIGRRQHHLSRGSEGLIMYIHLFPAPFFAIDH